MLKTAVDVTLKNSVAVYWSRVRALHRFYFLSLLSSFINAILGQMLIIDFEMFKTVVVILFWIPFILVNIARCLIPPELQIPFKINLGVRINNSSKKYLEAAQRNLKHFLRLEATGRGWQNQTDMRKNEWNRYKGCSCGRGFAKRIEQIKVQSHPGHFLHDY